MLPPEPLTGWGKGWGQRLAKMSQKVFLTHAASSKLILFCPLQQLLLLQVSGFSISTFGSWRHALSPFYPLKEPKSFVIKSTWQLGHIKTMSHLTGSYCSCRQNVHAGRIFSSCNLNLEFYISGGIWLSHSLDSVLLVPTRHSLLNDPETKRSALSQGLLHAFSNWSALFVQQSQSKLTHLRMTACKTNCSARGKLNVLYTEYLPNKHFSGLWNCRAFPGVTWPRGR